MRSIIYSSVIVIFSQLLNTVAAHSGGTDQYGCHTESSTGIYHCHNSSGSGASNSQEDDPYDGADFAEFAYVTHAIGAVALQFYFLSFGNDDEYSHILSISAPGIGAGIQSPVVDGIDIYLLSRFMNSTRTSFNFGFSPDITEVLSIRAGVGYIIDSEGFGNNTDLSNSENPQYINFTMDIGLHFNISKNFGLGASYDLSDESYWIDATFSL